MRNVGRRRDGPLAVGDLIGQVASAALGILGKGVGIVCVQAVARVARSSKIHTCREGQVRICLLILAVAPLHLEVLHLTVIRVTFFTHDGGQITDIEITKSCTIEPIYVNYDSYYTVTFTKENIYSGVTDASYDPEVTINNETLTSGDDFYSDSFNIVFDDTVDSATGLAPILIGIYEVGPNSNEFLSCDLDYDYTPYNGDADVLIKYILLEENNLPQILVYTGAETTYFVTAVVDNLEALKQFTFKIGYTDFEIDPNAVDYVIRDETGAEVDNPTEPGNYYLEYFLKNKTGVSSYELQLEIIAEP